MDDARLEEMIADCIEALDTDSERFTEWEAQFIEEVAEREDYTHMSDTQEEKLVQIWEERDCGSR